MKDTLRLLFYSVKVFLWDTSPGILPSYTIRTLKGSQFIVCVTNLITNRRKKLALLEFVIYVRHIGNLSHIYALFKCKITSSRLQTIKIKLPIWSHHCNAIEVMQTFLFIVWFYATLMCLWLYVAYEADNWK